jgi:chromosome segregation ATPase
LDSAEKIQDKTPLPQEQANAIREENIKLTLEHREVMEKIEKVQLEYSSKEKTLISQFSEKQKSLEGDFKEKKLNLEEKIKNEVELKVKELNDNLQQTYKAIEDRNNQITEKQELINSLESKISELETEISKLKPVTNELPIIDSAYKKAKESNDNYINNLTIEHIKILATFFENDSSVNYATFKNYVNKTYQLSKTLVDLRVSELSKSDIVKKAQFDYIVTEKGKKIIETIFT